MKCNCKSVELDACYVSQQTGLPLRKPWLVTITIENGVISILCNLTVFLYKEFEGTIAIYSSIIVAIALKNK